MFAKKVSLLQLFLTMFQVSGGTIYGFCSAISVSSLSKPSTPHAIGHLFGSLFTIINSFVSYVTRKHIFMGRGNTLRMFCIVRI